MDPTKLPTDNLWKFLALAGLALTGFCGWAIWKIIRYTLEEVAKLGEEASRLQAAAETSEARVTQLKKERASTTEAKAQLDALHKLQEASMVAQAKGESVGLGMKGLTYAMQMAKLGIVVGTITSIFGFNRWYVNVQWYADRQTKADFEDHMAELKAKAAQRAKVKP